MVGHPGLGAGVELERLRGRVEGRRAAILIEVHATSELAGQVVLHLGVVVESALVGSGQRRAVAGDTALGVDRVAVAVGMVEVTEGRRALGLARGRQVLVAGRKGGQSIEASIVRGALLSRVGNSEAVSVEGGLFDTDGGVGVVEEGAVRKSCLAGSVGRSADGARRMIVVPGFGRPDVGFRICVEGAGSGGTLVGFCDGRLV